MNSRLIYNIVVTEKIKIKESEIKELYEQSNGDIRFMINTLQFGSRKGKKNIQSTNIFETTGKISKFQSSILYLLTLLLIMSSIITFVILKYFKTDGFTSI